VADECCSSANLRIAQHHPLSQVFVLIAGDIIQGLASFQEKKTKIHIFFLVNSAQDDRQLTCYPHRYRKEYTGFSTNSTNHPVARRIFKMNENRLNRT
jgi:hypothetical protein